MRPRRLVITVVSIVAASWAVGCAPDGDAPDAPTSAARTTRAANAHGAHAHAHAAPANATVDLASAIRAMHRRAVERATLQDDGDLRPVARTILAQLRAGIYDPPAPPAGQAHALTLPKTIKVWRRSKGGSTSCNGVVENLPLEEYVKGVLPHEWIVSWQVESLRAGAVAIRTYAASWVSKGGKYSCADLDDTTRSQVYKDTRNAKASAAVDDTRGEVVVKNGTLVFAEYSAENGNPTKFGVNDPPCAGKSLFGHGRGMCQWGSQRWALQGKKYKWIAEHYYPGSTLLSTTAPPPPDQGVTPPDQGVTQPDAGAPAPDTSPVQPDAAGPRADLSGAPRFDLGAGQNPWQQPPQRRLAGGCTIAASSTGEDATRRAASALTMTLLLGAALLLSRRRSR